MTLIGLNVEKEQAKKMVDRFVSRFDESYRLLLYLAAIPLILTPELLNFLRHRFLRGQVSWVAEVDLLLSDLFKPVGYELYAMNSAVRAYLLENLPTFFQKEGLDEEQFQEVILILLSYINYLHRTNSFLSPAQLEAQQWAALAYLEDKKEQVFQEIKQAFQNCTDESQLARLSQITQELAPQLNQFPDLIQFATLVRDILLGLRQNLTQTKDQINQLCQTLELDLSSFPSLSVEKDFILQEFEFETVTVDRRGNLIKKEKSSAHYFSYDLDLERGISLEMVYIPGGTFLMGSPEGEEEHYNNESPQHQVTIQPFFMGKYPVTQAQWRAIANLPKVERNLKPSPSRFKGDNRPVETVSWYDAVEFCTRLSQYTGFDYSLPSEAEWEYSCRAGTSTPFHYGETITGDLVNYRANITYAEEAEGEYRGETTPVGNFPPNAFGLYDMHGNVWEFCLDNWHKNYGGAPNDGSAWMEEPNTTCVLRGGSWSDYPRFCRSAERSFYDSRDDYYYDSGFRVRCGFRNT